MHLVQSSSVTLTERKTKVSTDRGDGDPDTTVSIFADRWRPLYQLHSADQARFAAPTLIDFKGCHIHQRYLEIRLRFRVPLIDAR